MSSLFAKLNERKAAADANSIPGIVMSMLSRSDNGIVTIAPGIAERILEEVNFDGQRKKRPLLFRKHLNRLTSGAWNSNFPITFAALPGGEMILVDGQNRLSAIIEYGIATKLRINIATVKTKEDVRRLYAGFDEHDSSRTEIEVIDGVGLVEESGVPREIIRKGMRAIAVLLNGMEPSQSSASNLEARMLDSRLAAFPEWQDEMSAFADIIAPANRFIKNKLLNAGCMAVALYTLKHQPGRAREFWAAVANNDGLSKNDPRARLISDFQTRTNSRGSSRQVIQAPTLAWNAWNEKRELKIIKCVEGAAITIWGTPYSKGNR